MKNNLSSNEKGETNGAACADSKPCANGADTESRSGPTRRAFLGGTAATVAAGIVALPFLASKSVEAAEAGTQTSGGTVAGNRPAQQARGALRGRARVEQVYRH
ncbi:MAG TPA: twin-arginine translocation signal domain-containing protein, partial [Pyrinomonadaceae bacterium]|nr:twin-arginine translocation signal domain-containing protein [Pyrinomonadaceae bacterium]